MEKHGELRSITVEAAANGFMVTCQYEPPKTKKGQESWVEPDRYVYESAEAVLKKIGLLLNAGGLGKAKGGRSLAAVGGAPPTAKT